MICCGWQAADRLPTPPDTPRSLGVLGVFPLWKSGLENVFRGLPGVTLAAVGGCPALWPTIQQREDGMPGDGWPISPVVIALGGVQLLGLFAAAVARLAQGTRYEQLCQWACMLGLGIVGGSCGYAIQFGPHAAATAAVTLLLMTMIAVVDVRQRC